MKLTYVTPQMKEEVFTANEYVATCWAIGCARAYDGNSQEQQYGVSHGAQAEGTGCGHATNQAIRVADNGAVSMVELQTDGLGDLPCTITDANWHKTALNQSQVATGNTVYWTTTAADGRTWHHYGQIEGSDVNHS